MGRQSNLAQIFLYQKPNSSYTELQDQFFRGLRARKGRPRQSRSAKPLKSLKTAMATYSV
jgi:hypothetical protein